MIQCGRKKRWDLSNCVNKEKVEPATETKKEIDMKLLNAISERQRQDAELWGTPVTVKE